MPTMSKNVKNCLRMTKNIQKSIENATENLQYT